MIVFPLFHLFYMKMQSPHLYWGFDGIWGFMSEVPVVLGVFKMSAKWRSQFEILTIGQVLFRDLCLRWTAINTSVNGVQNGGESDHSKLNKGISHCNANLWCTLTANCKLNTGDGITQDGSPFHFDLLYHRHKVPKMPLFLTVSLVWFHQQIHKEITSQCPCLN